MTNYYLVYSIVIIYNIGKALHVTLSFFIDSLLAITINDKNYLITK